MAKNNRSTTSVPVATETHERLPRMEVVAAMIERMLEFEEEVRSGKLVVSSPLPEYLRTPESLAAASRQAEVEK